MDPVRRKSGNMTNPRNREPGANAITVIQAAIRNIPIETTGTALMTGIRIIRGTNTVMDGGMIIEMIIITIRIVRKTGVSGVTHRMNIAATIETGNGIITGTIGSRENFPDITPEPAGMIILNRRPGPADGMASRYRLPKNWLLNAVTVMMSIMKET